MWSALTRTRGQATHQPQKRQQIPKREDLSVVALPAGVGTELVDTTPELIAQLIYADREADPAITPDLTAACGLSSEKRGSARTHRHCRRCVRDTPRNSPD